MKKIFAVPYLYVVFALFCLPFGGFSQNKIALLKCYNNKTFKEADCSGCGFKANSFSGVVIRYQNKDWPFHNPIKVTVKGNAVTFLDAFGVELTLGWNQIATYNTVDKLTTFLTECKCDDCASGGGGGGGGGEDDIYLTNAAKSGNNLVLTMSSGTVFTITDIINKETIYLNGDGNPNSVAPTNDSNNRSLKVGDKYLDQLTGNIYRYNGSTWLLIFNPFLEYEEFTLNGSGAYTLATITASSIANVLTTDPARVVFEIEGQLQKYNRGDWTISGSTITLNGGAANAGNRGSILILK